MGSSGMVWWGPEQGRSFRRLIVAILGGWLVSWLGVAALVALSVALPHNPVPLVLLVVWAVVAVASLAIPGASFGPFRVSAPVLVVLALPFLPFARATVAVWPHLPDAVQDLLEGSFRSHRWARLQRKQGPPPD
jgi:hypothetical protein